MFRKVVSTRYYRNRYAAKGASTRIDTLECGHEAVTKGSTNEADKRKCPFCSSLEEGCTIIQDGIKYSWDKESNEVIQEVLTDES